ncbi:hypothetical protein COO60DRAFT_1703513 [Scenedesmus sp. NREL 46B-D3]|nr:hypothetical protein COO60DRAFT_1703513 [Scenedesmus sp. NREL 46B-D3]
MVLGQTATVISHVRHGGKGQQQAALQGGSMTGKDARFQRLAERFISEIPVHRDVLLKTLAAAQAEEYPDEESIAYLQQAVADVQQLSARTPAIVQSTTNIPGSMTAVVDSDV